MEGGRCISERVILEIDENVVELKSTPYSSLNCPNLCGQYKNPPVVDKIKF